jgi:Ala-tRNA(Pro) deacylase
VDFTKLRKLLNATSLSLASEADIQHAFPGVEVGAMSMFGNLYSVPVVVDKSLAESVEIVCNAGTHSETMKLLYRDFERAVKPKVGAFLAAQPAASKSKPKSKPKKKAAAKRPARLSPRRPEKKAARARR